MEDNLAESIIMTKRHILGPSTNTLGNFPLGIYADKENLHIHQVVYHNIISNSTTENKCLFTQD